MVRQTQEQVPYPLYRATVTITVYTVCSASPVRASHSLSKPWLAARATMSRLSLDGDRRSRDAMALGPKHVCPRGFSGGSGQANGSRGSAKTATPSHMHLII